MFRPDQFVTDQDGGVFQHISQFADIAGPGISVKQFKSLQRNPWKLLTLVLTEEFQKIVHQQWNIFFSFS